MKILLKDQQEEENLIKREGLEITEDLLDLAFPAYLHLLVPLMIYLVLPVSDLQLHLLQQVQRHKKEEKIGLYLSLEHSLTGLFYLATLMRQELLHKDI